MKYILLPVAMILIVSLSSCNSSDNSPVETINSKPKTIRLSNYGSIIDSSYYKLWSDNSWDKFNKVVKLNGITYTTVLNNNGDEYYYSVLGYAGFKAKNQTLIIFDKPLPSLPDTIEFGKLYTRSTTFYYQGYNYTLQYQQTLSDTLSVSVPFGVFNSCLWFTSRSTISAGGQSEIQNTQFWVAKGPSDIKLTSNSGTTIVMTKGVVNGKRWGMDLPKMDVSKEKKYTRFDQVANSIQFPNFHNFSLIKSSY